MCTRVASMMGSHQQQPSVSSKGGWYDTGRVRRGNWGQWKSRSTVRSAGGRPTDSRFGSVFLFAATCGTPSPQVACAQSAVRGSSRRSAFRAINSPHTRIGITHLERAVQSLKWRWNLMLLRKSKSDASARSRLTPRWSGRVNDKVPSSNVGARAAQLNR